jgi:hypothetical protein
MHGVCGWLAYGKAANLAGLLPCMAFPVVITMSPPQAVIQAAKTEGPDERKFLARQIPG